MDTWDLNKDVVSSGMEKPVKLRNGGKDLFGIFHPAVNNSKKVGVVFLNAGLQNRAGPHRMYVKTARALSQIGCCSLRMDFSGVGDSEGEITDLHFDCFDVEETLLAINFLTQEEMIEKVVLLGTCAGARNALKTAARDTRVHNVILWSLPFYYPLNSIKGRSISQTLSRSDAKYQIKQWMRKIMSVRLCLQYIFTNKNKNLPSLIKNVLRSLILGEKVNNKVDNNYHEFFREFFEAFELFFSSKRKAFFVYGAQDIFMKMFEEKLKNLSDSTKDFLEYFIVQNADHAFTSLASEKAVIVKTIEWLFQQYDLNNKKDLESLICHT
ncbi:MAG: hypothetical protein MRJ65_11195 [Candidatus Brocadiaceae bacterium]|nr:hypothetical protein [Candidatus Brocadiaceae bacterium]